MSRLLVYVMLPVLIACALIASRFVSWDSLKGEDPQALQFVVKGTEFLGRQSDRDNRSAVSAFTRELDLSIHGTDGVLRVEHADPDEPTGAVFKLSGARRGGDGLSQIEIPPENRGAWRVEEEFINAVRGIEPVTHTNFTDGLKYMQFTDAVTESVKTGNLVRLPF